MGLMAYVSRHSTCSPPRATPISTATISGTWRELAQAGGGRSAVAGDKLSRGECAGRGGVRRGRQLVGRDDQPGQRRHGGEAARFRRPWRAWPRAARAQDVAAASICASSMGQTTPSQPTWNVCVRADCAPSARWLPVSLPWVSNHWSALSGGSHFGACIRRCSRCWRSNRSR